LIFSDIEGAHYDAWPLGHKKLETTTRYTRVTLKTIGAVRSPLEELVRDLEDERSPLPG
jgi:hypothetical protein